MQSDVVESKSDAILNWRDQELADSKDMVGSIDQGEQVQLLRVQNGDTVDVTQQAYTKAMQKSLFLKILIDFVKDAAVPGPVQTGGTK
jgi:hypothetical protein